MDWMRMNGMELTTFHIGKFAQTQNIYSDAIGACGDEGHIDDGDGGYWW